MKFIIGVPFQMASFERNEHRKFVGRLQRGVKSGTCAVFAVL